MLVATKAFIEQALQTIALKALNVAAKTALALAQYQGGLILGHDPRSPEFDTKSRFPGFLTPRP